MDSAIVTGGNGFIGARLIRLLLKNGWRVHALGRPTGDVSWGARMTAALDDIEGTPVDPRLLTELHFHEVDLMAAGLGIEGPVSEQFPEAGAVLFHVAGDTRFIHPDPELQHRINVGGARHVLECFRGRLRQAVHVSTAYVAGDRRGLVLEGEFDEGQTLRNSYEKSKLAAELGVLELCESLDIPLAIVRPSIITNDTETGRSSTLTHLNALAEVVGRVQEHFGLHDGEVVSREIRIPADAACRPNLAAVDPIVLALFEIGVHPEAPGRVYHLCHPDPQTNAEILDLLAEAFGVRDKVTLSFVAELTEPLSWTEKMMVRALGPYVPYMNEYCTFDLRNTRSIIRDYDSWFEPVSLEYVRKVIAFQRSQGEV